MLNSLLMAGAGLGFIFLMTCLGASTVFVFRKATLGPMHQIFLGFAAGVMVAASIWSLLLPAIEQADAQGLMPGWVPAAGGFVLGVLFLLALDNITPHLHPFANTREGPASMSKRTTLLISAVTLHNIPEGMAVGLSFALAGQSGDPAMYASAFALALGIGIQNFPEGAAISLPLLKDGISRRRAFGLGCASGAVEPLFGALAVALAWLISPLMPWLLSFSAGAMIYVVVEELIPEAQLEEHPHAGTLGFAAGFLIMMVLDVALG
ncbi:MAG: ZIP family metal transporter [Treponema sp.]|nr:ZIP family metal transporter [Treponema sp.]